MHAVRKLSCQVALLPTIDARIYIDWLIQLFAESTARILILDLVSPTIFVISVVVITVILINDLFLPVPMVLLERAIFAQASSWLEWRALFIIHVLVNR